jgi:DNA-binding beta-propeller fold protein YncE
MASRYSITAWRAPLAPPSPVASLLEPQAPEEVLASDVSGFRTRPCRGVHDGHRKARSRPDSEEWTPAETAIAAIWVDGRVHDISVSPDGEHLFVARSDSVMVINGGHHIVGSIPVTGPVKSLLMGEDGTRLFVIHYDGSVAVVDTHDYTVQTPWGGCASNVVVSPDGRHL